MKTPAHDLDLRSCLLLAFVCSGSASAQELPPEAPVMHIIEVEQGVNLHVAEWGGEGSPMLFVPSWSATSHVFDTFAPSFTDSHRVLVINKRGHGPSSRPDHGYTIDRLTKDIEVVLDDLCQRRSRIAHLRRPKIAHF